MLPDSGKTKEIRFVGYPSRTYNLDYENNKIERDIDGLEAVKQAVYKILQTERYKYGIYNWNYGFELDDLYGKDKGFVMPELKRRITEALVQDDRIKAVSGFTFTQPDRNTINATFTVETVFGGLEIKNDFTI